VDICDVGASLMGTSYFWLDPSLFSSGQKRKILQWHQWALFVCHANSQKPADRDWGNCGSYMSHGWFSFH